MNLLLLTIAFRAWSGSALAAFLRLFAAIATFSLEMQLATWLHAGSIQSLRLANLAAAAVGVLWHARHVRQVKAEQGDREPPSVNRHPSGTVAVPPLAAIAAVAVVVGLTTFALPVAGADPYHLHRVDQITRLGTLAYDPAAPDIKVNALAGVYELLLADLRIPGMSTALVRLHGLLGLAMYTLAIAVIAPWIAVRRRWLLVTFLVIPVVFHQFVLVKNDLFGALPAFVALTWVVIRGGTMRRNEVAAAAALAGFAAGVKISSSPVALTTLAFALIDHRRDWRTAGAAIAAVLAGGIAGGLLFALIANEAVYGGALRPYSSLGNRYDNAGDALVGMGRFAISLFDLGEITPRVWSGRGGWGSTFGLPMLWAAGVLVTEWRDATVRRALVASAACFLVFSATYPDADIAHRMVIAPGLLLIAVAIGCVDRDRPYAVWSRGALVVTIALSAAQIARSVVLYLRLA